MVRGNRCGRVSLVMLRTMLALTRWDVAGFTPLILPVVENRRGVHGERGRHVYSKGRKKRMGTTVCIYLIPREREPDSQLPAKPQVDESRSGVIVLWKGK